MMKDKSARILTLLKEMVGIYSLTGTAEESRMETWLLALLETMGPAVQAGRIPVGDRTGRTSIYGFIRSRQANADTVIFMNHHDVVDLEPYGDLAATALLPDKLEQALAEQNLDAEVQSDLQSGEWLFGRGACDMKGGIAAQLAVFEEYAKQPDGCNLLFLSVPDEESFSIGMRTALPFLQELKETHGLQYSLLVNCEPDAMQGSRLIAFSGSVGKLLPVVFVQGKTAHIGNYKQGINPIGILSRMIAATEGKWELADRCGEEISPPPAWMYMRDQKEKYDFSLPYRAAAYGSFLSYEKTPVEILRILKGVAMQAAADNLPVITFSEFIGKRIHQPEFRQYYQKILQESEALIQNGNSTFPEQTVLMVQQLLDFAGETEPLILLAYAPPYYPATDSLIMAEDRLSTLITKLENTYPLHFNHYFNGVSDCSYCGIRPGFDVRAVSDNMPLWGKTYSFDLPLLQELHIPFLLMGPWGKDLHGCYERVHIRSVARELPERLQFILNDISQYS